jgi:PAS domain S-box-containing protein
LAGATQTIVDRVSHPDGVSRDIEAIFVPDKAPDGRVAGVFVMIQDVSDRIRAEAALRGSEARMRRVLDALPMNVSLIGPDRRYEYLNKTSLDWHGLRLEEAVGKEVADIIGRGAYEMGRSRFDAAFAGEGATFEAEVRYETVGHRNVQVSFVPDLDAERRVVGVFSMIVDLTDRKRAEELLRQAQKMEAVGQLTGGIAHDFNNLLAVILGNADLAKEELHGDDAVSGYLDALIRAAVRGADLTRHLLAFLRKQPLRPQSIEADALVDGMNDFLRRVLGERIQIVTRHEPGLWMIEVDSAQLENAILNLAINARDAMPDGGALTIKAHNVRTHDDFTLTNPDLEAGPYVKLEIGDTGVGMPEEVVEHIFEPFFTTKEVGEGSGLGLSMVSGFIRQTGGHVEIESEVGKGTMVKLYLPAVPGADDEAEAAAGKEGSGDDDTETILVVEDDDEVRALAIGVLEGLGYVALGVADGEAALATLREHPERSPFCSATWCCRAA